VQLPPYVANSGGSSPVGYYGSAQDVVWNGPPHRPPYVPAKRGPERTPPPRAPDRPGPRHDGPTPFPGHLAPQTGAQQPLPPGTFSGLPGTAVDGKAAFNNCPYQYGIVERTYSGRKASRDRE